MKRFSAFFLVAFLLFNVGGVFAQSAEEDDPPEMLDQKPLLGQLQLNDQQKKQIEQMRIDMERQLVGVRAKAEMARLDMRQLLNAENPDKAAIEKKMNELAQIRVQAGTVRLNQWFEVNKILTAEQQKVWREVLKHPLRERIKGAIGRGMMERRLHDCCRPFMRGGAGPHGPGPRMMERPVPEKK